MRRTRFSDNPPTSSWNVPGEIVTRPRGAGGKENRPRSSRLYHTANPFLSK